MSRRDRHLPPLPPGPKEGRDLVRFHYGQPVEILGAWAERGGGTRLSGGSPAFLGHLAFAALVVALPSVLVHFALGQPAPKDWLEAAAEARWPFGLLPAVLVLLGLNAFSFFGGRQQDAIWVRTHLGLSWLRLGTNLPRDPSAFEHWAWADVCVLPSTQKDRRYWLGPKMGLRQALTELEGGLRPPKAPHALPGPAYTDRLALYVAATEAWSKQVKALYDASDWVQGPAPKELDALTHNPAPPPTLQGHLPLTAWPIDVAAGQPAWVDRHELPWEEGPAFWKAVVQQSAG